MKLYRSFSIVPILVLILFNFPGYSSARGSLQDYQRAEKFIHFNVDELIFNLEVQPHWLEQQSKFWYLKETTKGQRFYLVDAEKELQRVAFNHEKLAKALNAQLDKPIKSDSLPFQEIAWNVQHQAILFKTDSLKWKWSLSEQKLQPSEDRILQTGDHESLSPDSSYVAFVKDYNLYVFNRKTEDTTQLTFDGIEKYDYATQDSWYRVSRLRDAGESYDPSIQITWSPNSSKFIAYKLDRRDVNNMYLYQSNPPKGKRAKVWSYERPLPGEEAKKYEFFVFDAEEKTKIKIDIPPYATFLSSVWPQWTENGENIYLARFSRGYKSIDLFFVDPNTGNANVIVHDTSETMVEYQMIHTRVVENGNYFLWTSERDNWNHIYLYNHQGDMVRQVTQGAYVVHDIVHVDEEKQVIWFTAGGREENRDPYFSYLYKVNFDGSNLQLLTPENAHHKICVAKNGKYFVDTYSRVDLKPHSVLRRMKTGQKVLNIQEATIKGLRELGWKPPRPFKVKARDGKTNLYGVLYLPSDFTPGGTYPVIDASYSGPQAVYTPKTFDDAVYDSRLPLAELGFAVITVDGMGTAMRSKSFHDVSYQNLGDIGAPDHIGAIRQLAARYNYLDTNHIGIYGHSAGGYDAAHAMFAHPEFYDVAVSSAGNHDHAMAKAWWPEQYMGMPGTHYTEQSNLNLAEHLQGKLLLVHGDLDNNVNPACTYRLAAELVEQNKDFDLLIIPNRNHGGLYSNPYFIRKRWDYFVRNLMKVEPPKEYEIEKK